MLCVRKWHHSLSHRLQTTAGKTLVHSRLWTHQSFLTDHVSKSPPPSQALCSVPLEKYSCCWPALLPPLLPRTPSARVVPLDLRMSATGVGIGKVGAGADLCVLQGFLAPAPRQSQPPYFESTNKLLLGLKEEATQSANQNKNRAARAAVPGWIPSETGPGLQRRALLPVSVQ